MLDRPSTCLIGRGLDRSVRRRELDSHLALARRRAIDEDQRMSGGRDHRHAGGQRREDERLDSGGGFAGGVVLHRDLFNLCDKSPVPRERPGAPAHSPMTLPEAQVAIMLATVSGGMYELGDDLPTLGSEKDRLALVTNPDVMAAVRLSKSFTPLDLLSYDAEDLVPSVFFLREDQRQSLLAVFNWTEKPRSHTLTLARLGLPAGRNLQTADIFHAGEPVAIESGAIHLDNQPPHSVRVIKFINHAIPSVAPKVTAQVPAAATIGVAVQLAAKADATGEPALAYHWDFGDGTSADGARTSHAFTMNGDYTVRLTVDGMDGVPFQGTFPVKVTGNGIPLPEIRKNQRYSEPSDR